MKARVIVCAANRCTRTKEIVCGARHWDSTMRPIIDRIVQHEAEWTTYEMTGEDWEQGFIDQHGVFLTRTEAWKVAEAAGQIKHRCGGDTTDGGTLYSENLY